MMADLFADCSSGEEESGDLFKTDNRYARNYDEWRSKEELMKAKARYGNDLEVSSGESDDESDEEYEDDEASQWTSEHEKKFLATLSALKGHDPKIYKKDEIIFGEVQPPTEDNEVTKVTISSQQKKMTLKDYERKIISEEGGIYADDEDAGPRFRLFEDTQQEKLAYDDEQKALRDSLKAAAWAKEDASEDDDDLAGGLVSRKQRKIEERVKDEEDYIKWLKGETDRLSNKKEAKELASLRQLWTENEEYKLNEAEKFLRDYVLNKRYLTVKEDDLKFEVDLSEDEKDVEQMNEFEQKYNFRFEDPDPEFIKRYPRTIEDSMRRKDTRRADKKAEKKSRKEQERVQIREEVNRLKSMKKKEILNRIDKLKNIAGSADIAFDEADVDGDFDPEEHDRRMAALFASYDEQAGEDIYPELADDDNDIDDLRFDDWDKYEGENDQLDSDQDSSDSELENDCGKNKEKEKRDSSGETVLDVSEESQFAPDRVNDNEGGHGSADSSDSGREGIVPEKDGAAEGGIERSDEGKLLIRGRKSTKLTLEDVLQQKKEKKRKKSKFAQVLGKRKPTFDPERDESFEKYFDEYYKLDFEDVVGGLQTRFKYRQVVPNDFGLSTEEVLNAQDRELNKWCTLKKMVQYRSQDEERRDLQIFAKRKEHMHLKQKILTSVYPTDGEKPDTEIIKSAPEVGNIIQIKAASKSRKNKKKKQRGAQKEDEEQNQFERATEKGICVSNDELNAEKNEEEPLSRKRKGGNVDDTEAVERTQKKPKVVEEEHESPDRRYRGNKIRIKNNRPLKHLRRVHYEPDPGNVKQGCIEKIKGSNNKISQTRVGQRKFAKKFDDGNNRSIDKLNSFPNGRIQKKKKSISKDLNPKVEVAKTGPEQGLTETLRVDPIPWDQLTAKQKKNRRNALIKKRKRAEIKERRMEKATEHKTKFQPLDDLKMSVARMKAYGLNPNRVKGSLIYSRGLPSKNMVNDKQDKN